MGILEFSNVVKRYGEHIEVLPGVSFSLEEQEVCALLGPSGTGKSTLLALAAGLEPVTSGSITLCGQVLTSLDEEQRTTIRREKLGFVFQTFELIPNLTALENVMVPAELLGRLQAEEFASNLLDEVGLAHRLHHLPAELSGGERQRVALARAFINQPKILFADEPTGNLDRRNSDQIGELLLKLNEEHSTTLFIATHDLTLAERCQRTILLEELL